MTKGGALPRTTLQILLALAQGPMHGYGIKLDVEERTGGAVRLGSGTLYEAIQRLLDNGWIEEVERPADSDASGGTAGQSAARRCGLSASVLVREWYSS